MDLAVVTIPPSATHTHTIILLHNSGTTARDFVSTLHNCTDSRWWSLVQCYASVRWVFPQAESGSVDPKWFGPPMMATTADEGRGGHRVDDNDGDDDNEVKDGGDVRDEMQVESLKGKVVSLKRLVEAEVAMLGDMWERVVIGGVDQGAIAAVHTLLSFDVPAGDESTGWASTTGRRLGGLIAMSCYSAPLGNLVSLEGYQISTAATDDTKDDRISTGTIIRETPVLIEQWQRPDLGRALRDALEARGASVCLKEHTNGEHWFNSAAGMDDIEGFLLENLGLRTGWN